LLAIGERVVPGIFFCLLTEKSPDLRLVFFRQRRTSPLFTTRLVGVKQAKTDGDIQIKKSRNDENKQPHKKSKRSSKPQVQPNKKGCKGGGNHHRSNNRNSGVGDSQTCNPRCGLGNIPHNRNTDNLLGINFLKHTTMKSSENFIEAIRNYLDSRAESDNLFAIRYADPSKSLSECCQFYE